MFLRFFLGLWQMLCNSVRYCSPHLEIVASSNSLVEYSIRPVYTTATKMFYHTINNFGMESILNCIIQANY